VGSNNATHHLNNPRYIIPYRNGTIGWINPEALPDRNRQHNDLPEATSSNRTMLNLTISSYGKITDYGFDRVYRQNG